MIQWTADGNGRVPFVFCKDAKLYPSTHFQVANPNPDMGQTIPWWGYQWKSLSDLLLHLIPICPSASARKSDDDGDNFQDAGKHCKHNPIWVLSDSPRMRTNYNQAKNQFSAFWWQQDTKEKKATSSTILHISRWHRKLQSPSTRPTTRYILHTTRST